MIPEGKGELTGEALHLAAFVFPRQAAERPPAAGGDDGPIRLHGEDHTRRPQAVYRAVLSLAVAQDGQHIFSGVNQGGDIHRVVCLIRRIIGKLGSEQLPPLINAA